MNIWGLWVAHPRALGQVSRCRHMFPPRAESLKSDQKADRYPPPPNIIVLVLLCWSLLGSRCWVGLLMAFPPAAYIKLPGLVKASQQRGRTNKISLWFRCAVFSENRILPSRSGGWPRSIACVVLGFSQDIPDWKNNKNKKNWGRYLIPVTGAFVNLRFLGRVLFSVWDNPN